MLGMDLSWLREIQLQVRFDEIDGFDEVVAAGTAAALVPIKSVTLRSKDITYEYLKADEPG